MTVTKEDLIDAFRVRADEMNEEVRRAGLNCICGDCNLAKFSIREIEEIIEKAFRVYAFDESDRMVEVQRE